MNGRSRDIAMSVSESERRCLGKSFLCIEKLSREAAHLAAPESPDGKSKTIENSGGNTQSVSSKRRIFQVPAQNFAGEGIDKPDHPIIVNS
jgi:hypothetical protein